MTTRTYLPDDVTRCAGDKKHVMCQHCARKAFENKHGEWTPHFARPPFDAERSDCAWFIDMEIDNN